MTQRARENALKYDIRPKPFASLASRGRSLAGICMRGQVAPSPGGRTTRNRGGNEAAGLPRCAPRTANTRRARRESRGRATHAGEGWVGQGTSGTNISTTPCQRTPWVESLGLPDSGYCGFARPRPRRNVASRPVHTAVVTRALGRDTVHIRTQPCICAKSVSSHPVVTFATEL